jgi:hypothetical protein
MIRTRVAVALLMEARPRVNLFLSFVLLEMVPTFADVVTLRFKPATIIAGLARAPSCNNYVFSI